MLEASHKKFKKESNQTAGNTKVQMRGKGLEKTSWVTKSDPLPFLTIFLVNWATALKLAEFFVPSLLKGRHCSIADFLPKFVQICANHWILLSALLIDFNILLYSPHMSY